MLDEEGPESRHVEPVKGLTRSLHYLTLRQKSDVLYTGVKGKEEIQLFGRLVARLLHESCSMTAISTFRRLYELWNQMAVETNKIYCKYPEQLMQYYKLWGKSNIRK